MVTKGERGGRINQETVINIYTPLYIKQIPNKNPNNNQDLLYITGNSTQYSVIIYMGKGPEKRRDIYVCKLIPFVVHEKPTQHCKLSIH